MASTGTIDDFCRLCAVESHSGVIIYSNEGESLCLEEKILNCLRIDVSRDDMLPKRVCQSCSLLLEDYYRFSERAAQVQQTLYFLLGLHLPQSSKQDPQLFLLNGVKVESNLIKKELDEFLCHQGGIGVEEEKTDIILPGSSISMKDQSQYCELKYYKRVDDNTSSGPESFVNSDCVSDEFKQIHKNSKMILPKKGVLVSTLIDSKGIEKNSENNLEYFKLQKAGEKEKCQDFSVFHEKVGNKEKVEIKELKLEWRKNWGIFCDHCQTIMPEKSEYEKHYKYKHSKNVIYTCSYCKTSFEKYASYDEHTFEHIYNGKFRCKACNKRFCAKDLLQIHLSLIHCQKNIYICEKCGKCFTSQPRLNLHQNKHKSMINEELRCLECGKILKTKSGLAAHKSVHKLGRNFMCHICGKTFTQKINMQQHVKHHKGEKPHSCDICEKSFSEKSHLNRHKSFHTNDRPYQCPVCKKMYKTERCLKVHSQTHWSSRPYLCSYCGKGFLSSTKLKQHYNCHTGERPFACKYCDRTFTNYPNWLKHTRRRHKVDHKTGISLKEESGSMSVTSSNPISKDNSKVSEAGIEFIEIPEVEVKEDGRDSVHSQSSSFSTINPSFLGSSQFQIVEEETCLQYRMGILPDQMAYSELAMVHQDSFF